nr:MAG TPA: hypothetical protein [Caudoviricetes sp.]
MVKSDTFNYFMKGLNDYVLSPSFSQDDKL